MKKKKEKKSPPKRKYLLLFESNKKESPLSGSLPLNLIWLSSPTWNPFKGNKKIGIASSLAIPIYIYKMLVITYYKLLTIVWLDKQ